ncbi:hypothetical protein GCM10022269_13220 [Sphingorhabdus rigui]
METRLIVAFVLITITALALIFVAVRYSRRRKLFKIRQMGRGKAMPGSRVNAAP